ncbi:lytic polysaccharide monooxygenase [Cellulosimicrobium marinum]|uniref:lytic polysaccharide monooxygenase n=1 Tax=Cellulosimicrobium marinum TaxID=1638992 RepID=UPI001E38F445|nr:lytic polysaccharide monooxygenase [Cellulosimicrobium marinum]MCB7136136.1 lytic polysaccharide monooxygenase [Cellulosimicrobium marinum]
MKRLRAALVAVVMGAAAIVAPIAIAPSASAHGWITSPPSRQDHCATGTTSFSCGGLQYEPQSVEAVKGSMQCSGGSGYDILDDESKPWPRTTTGSEVTFQWKLTANHATSVWEYFVDGKLFASFDGGGVQPPKDISHTLTGLPEGNHTILARWSVADTVNAFYNCVDLNITANGTNPGGGDNGGGDTGGGDTGGQPGECTDPAWSASSVYTGGAKVSHNGNIFEAKWWTQNNTPGAEEWGPWKLVGAC